ncbi:hypothetical protein AAFJ72_10810 [Brevibacillus gelatini]|uniref:hypothetical protein n=1 Tax=Brevibacillus gelatini TaxID=1655277 RepID=UPI003D814CC7
MDAIREYVRTKLLWNLAAAFILVALPYFFQIQLESRETLLGGIVFFIILTLFDILSISGRLNP